MLREYSSFIHESADLLHIDVNQVDAEFLRSDRFQISYERAIKNIDSQRSCHGGSGNPIFIFPSKIANRLNKDKTCRDRYFKTFLMLLEEKLAGLFIVENGREYLYFIWDKNYCLEEVLDYKLSCICFIEKRFAGLEEMIWIDKKYRLSFSYISASTEIKRGELIQDTAAFIAYTENCRVRQANSTNPRWTSIFTL